MKKTPICSIVIVTHNSEKYVKKAMESLKVQTRQPDQIIIVDSGSKDTRYLMQYADQSNVVLVLDSQDIGFCKANNVAMTRLSKFVDYVFFLNPDAMLAPHFLEEAINYMEMPNHQDVGALTGQTLGYDIDADKPTGMYDTTGIFQKWYGKWYDRGQGDVFEASLFYQEESIPAICGAVFFCRKKALDTILLRGNEVFDNTFYMYKDDIDLSLRLRKANWDIKYVPALIAYHCRGWHQDRKRMPRKLRLCSALNELRIHARARGPIPLAYSLCKYAAVKIFDK